ncbi:MAG: hypothetical protein HC906_05975 [Bacteroidales bacterium]|nr:hypothetical protein [Bacteroidales bacterium]
MAKKLISLKVKCPHCDKSLMDYTQYLNAKPSIKLKLDHEEKQGVINLCSTFGCYDKIASIPLIEEKLAHLSCPSCNKNLEGNSRCDLCHAPIVEFNLEKGGKVHVCSRVGCTKHFVSFEDIYDTLTNFYNEYDYGANERDF